MNQKEFVEGIMIAVERSSVAAMKELLHRPAGRNPNAEVLKRSDWYNSLPDEEKDMVIEIAAESIKTSVFSFLCVLDNVKTIEDDMDKGIFKLYFEKGGKKVLINDPSEEFLHDLYNSAD